MTHVNIYQIMSLSHILKEKSAVIIGLLVVSLMLAATSPWGRELVVKREPPETDNLFLLGQYYFNHGPHADGTYDIKLARHYYEQALADNPLGDNWAWYQLGRIDFLEGKFDAAIYKFNKQVEHFEDQQPSVYYMLGLTYGYRARREGKEDDWHRAAEYFSHYLEHDENSPWARVDMAWIYFSQGRFEEMKPILEKGLSTHGDNPWLLNMYGLALLNTGHKEEARRNFTAALEEAEKLTPENWGLSYPGNDPSAWSDGLREFRTAIRVNLGLAQ